MNKAIIHIEVEECKGDCPFVEYDNVNFVWKCEHEMIGEIIPDDGVPSWCLFLVKEN